MAHFKGTSERVWAKVLKATSIRNTSKRGAIICSNRSGISSLSG